MLPDWQVVNRLLVACSFDYTAVANQLQPAMQVLRQSLPHSHITLLTSEATGYTLWEGKQVLGQAGITEVNSQSSNLIELSNQLRSHTFDVAIIFTKPCQSCYRLAYICYLSGIPVRLAQSLEFGGKVLSKTIKPPIDSSSLAHYHLHLIEAIGLSTSSPIECSFSHQI
jgi:hypothetical protein